MGADLEGLIVGSVDLLTLFCDYTRHASYIGENVCKNRDLVPWQSRF